MLYIYTSNAENTHYHFLNTFSVSSNTHIPICDNVRAVYSVKYMCTSAHQLRCVISACARRTAQHICKCAHTRSGGDVRGRHCLRWRLDPMSQPRMSTPPTTKLRSLATVVCYTGIRTVHVHMHVFGCVAGRNMVRNINQKFMLAFDLTVFT